MSSGYYYPEDPEYHQPIELRHRIVHGDFSGRRNKNRRDVIIEYDNFSRNKLSEIYLESEKKRKEQEEYNERINNKLMREMEKEAGKSWFGNVSKPNSNWIKKAIKRPGSLIKYAHKTAPGTGKKGAFTKSGKLRMSWLRKIKKEGTSLRKKQATLALTLKKIKRKNNSKKLKNKFGNNSKTLKKPKKTKKIKKPKKRSVGEIKKELKSSGMSALKVGTVAGILFMANKSNLNPFTRGGTIRKKWLHHYAKDGTPRQKKLANMYLKFAERMNFKFLK